MYHNFDIVAPHHTESCNVQTPIVIFYVLLYAEAHQVYSTVAGLFTPLTWKYHELQHLQALKVYTRYLTIQQDWKQVQLVKLIIRLKI